MKLLPGILLLFVLISQSGIAQSKEVSGLSRKTKAVYDKAKAAWDTRNLPEATPLFEKVLETDPDFAEAHLRLAQIYELQRDRKRTEFHYRKVAKLKEPSSETAPAWLYLGKAFIERSQYDSALIVLKKIHPFYKPKTNAQAVIDKLISNSEFALKAIQNPYPVQKTPLPEEINFLKVQFFPVLTADQETLIFTGLTQSQNEDIYESTWTGESWSKPRILSENIHTSQNEGTCTISADGRTLVFTGCDRPDGYGSCDLYISHKTANGWGPPKNLGSTVNSSSWETQPSLSADGKTIYFVSNRPGGKGKGDIWTSSLDSTSNWTTPTNLGSEINTKGEESAPFIHANGNALFFSSDEHTGMGGSDLFLTRKIDGKWSQPINLGYPINTSADQVGLYITSDGKKAYYTDNRLNEENGRSLIYTFPVPDTLAKLIVPTKFLKGRVTNRIDGRPVEATIKLYDLTTGQIVGEFSSDSHSGNYLITLNTGSHYAAFVEANGFLFKSLTFDVNEKQSSVRLDIALEKLEKDKVETLNNIYFASGQSKLDDRSATELDKMVQFLKQNATVAIEISGHTDDVGNEKDNMQLSLDRARAVADYLKNRHVDPGRLKFTGLGEGNPKVPNNSEENRRINRRIEWKIL